MIGVTLLLLLVGSWIFYSPDFSCANVNYKTAIQAVIILLIGGGGATISFKEPPTKGRT
jgi:hypothetical protein